MQRLLTILLLLFTMTQFGWAQDRTISGKVTDAETGEGLISVQIKVKDSDVGTLTDFDGNYTLPGLSDGDIVVFKYVGFDEQEVTVGSGGQMNIKMATSAVSLNQVVVSASRRKEKVLDAPASISLIDASAIENKVSVSTTDQLKGTSGVDIIKSGLNSGAVVVRGFNNIFGGSLLSLVDNRIARVPSLRVNAYQMIPSNDDDIARMEILRGPASALYGPNVANGVMHIITKSPLDVQETKVSFGVGFRSKIDGEVPFVWDENSGSDVPYTPVFDNDGMGDRMVLQSTLRHAGKLPMKNEDGLQIGYKISGTWFNGDDWKYNDPFEPTEIVRSLATSTGEIPLDADGNITAQDSLGNYLPGDTIDNRRIYDIKKYSLDGRLDFRFNRDTELILAAGYNNAANVELTGIGAAISKGWAYTYQQARFRYKDLFLQAFVNTSDAGDETFLLRSGNATRDNSKLWVAQIQHSYEPMPRMNFIYGIDALWTRPDTKNTINGRFDSDDDINEYGVYVQGDYSITPQLDILGAIRADYHNYVDDVFLSPRAAIVYKPSYKHNFRLTYNRAFGSPSSNNLFLDILQLRYPTGQQIRAQGNQGGFDYSIVENPFRENAMLPQFRTSLAGTDVNQYYHVGDNSVNNEAWATMVGVVAQGFIEQAPTLASLIPGIVDLIIPQDVTGIGHVVRDVNLTTGAYEESDWENLQDVGSIKNTVTKTYEIGYKGILSEKLFVTVDVYRSDMKDFVSPITSVSPAVLFDPADIQSQLIPQVVENYEGLPDFLKDQLNGLLDGNTDYGDGTMNGTGSDEMAVIVAGATGQLPLGTITPAEADGDALLVSYKNIGDISIMGADLGINYYATDQLKLNFNTSWVDKDSIQVDGAQFGYIALNAPKFKTALGATYSLPDVGVDLGVRWRYQDGYPANSGAYVGHVNAIHDMDVDVSWRPNFYKNLQLSSSISNLYNNEQQHFVGTPLIGRLVMFRVAHTF